MITELEHFGGAAYKSFGASFNLRQLARRVQSLSATAGGLAVTLPQFVQNPLDPDDQIVDALGVPVGRPSGGPYYYLLNVGGNTIDLKQPGGTTFTNILANRGRTIALGSGRYPACFARQWTSIRSFPLNATRPVSYTKVNSPCFPAGPGPSGPSGPTGSGSGSSGPPSGPTPICCPDAVDVAIAGVAPTRFEFNVSRANVPRIPPEPTPLGPCVYADAWSDLGANHPPEARDYAILIGRTLDLFGPPPGLYWFCDLTYVYWGECDTIEFYHPALADPNCIPLGAYTQNTFFCTEAFGSAATCVLTES